MIYVYEPGADIEINFDSNSVGMEIANGRASEASHSEVENEMEAVAEILRTFGTANGDGESPRGPPNSPETTYCMAKTSNFECVRHMLKNSILFGNALSTFDIVSTYA